DGKGLLSTCGYGDCLGKPQIVWEVGSGKRLQQLQQHDDIVIAAAISPDGRFAATGGHADEAIRVWELAMGAPVNSPQGKPLVLAGTGASGWAVGFSADGQRIAWGAAPRFSAHNDRGPLGFQLHLPRKAGELGQPERLDAAAANSFGRSRAEFDTYAISHRAGTRQVSGDIGFEDAFLDIKKDGRVVASIKRGSTDGYRHRAYTFTPDGKNIISGGNNGVLIAYDMKGQKLGDFIGHQNEVWALAPSPDGRFLVSGSADQTVRLWNLRT